MPSPLAHLAAGLALYRAGTSRLADPPERGWRPASPVLALTLLFTLAPDLDAVPGLLLGDLGRYHNNLAGSPFFGLLVALLGAALVAGWRREPFLRWFAIALGAYWLHVLMDFLTVGRGVMLLWPWSTERFSPPLHAFYGLHWSQGLWSRNHLWTLASEAVFAAILLLLADAWARRREARRKVAGP